MPKEITHCLLAERAVHAMATSTNDFKKHVGREIYFLFEKHPHALYFGSVSPDIFYYDIHLPWEFRIKHRGALWGDLIHGTDGEDSLAHVRAMLDILRTPGAEVPLARGRMLSRDEKNILLLFTLGYLSHVALDTILHPIVYYYSGNYHARDKAERLRAEARHRAIETIFDLYNLDSVGSKVRIYRAKNKIALPAGERDLILGFYALSLLRAWPELAKREFGLVADIPTDIYRHPLFKVALRSYKKQVLFNRLFQNRHVARWGLALNRKRQDSLHYHSSLLYPANSYTEYQKQNHGQFFSVEDIKDYRDPLDNRLWPIRKKSLTGQVVARTHAFFRSAYLYGIGKMERQSMARVLKGYSLNNGRVGVATSAMRYYAPLAIDGNFAYIMREEGRS